jgi:three-Cys-motif partner protein
MMKAAQRQLLEEQRAQSVYKLAILRRYLAPMIGKLANLKKPIMLIDGFAGTGYSGADKGSTALMLDRAASKSNKARVKVRAVEADSGHFNRLSQTVDEYRAKGCDAAATLGTIEQHLPALIAEATQHTLFMFLDPYGANVPYSLLEGILANDRAARYPPTEALLNISGPLIFREAGVVKAGSQPSQTKRVDAALGGSWWHQYAGLPADQLVKTVTEEYASRLAAAANMTYVVVPVRRHPRNVVPVYHLVYLTRSPDHGVATFVDAVGRARPEYMEATEDSGDMTLFGTTAPEWAKQQATDEAKATKARIKENLRRIARDGSSFRPFHKVLAVYGDDVGVATDTQVNAAIKELLDAGELTVVTPPPASKYIQGTYARTATGISSQ